MVFKPTFLYIKRHNDTGLLYFGKTVNKDPIKYPGSGLYWRRHLKKNGKNVSTIWHEQFDLKEDLIEFATFFSEFNNIIISKEWANLINENGLDGNSVGFKHSEETKLKLTKPKTVEHRLKIAKSHTGKVHSEEHRLQNSKSNTGKKRSVETRIKMSEAASGKTKSCLLLLWT